MQPLACVLCSAQYGVDFDPITSELVGWANYFWDKAGVQKGPRGDTCYHCSRIVCNLCHARELPMSFGFNWKNKLLRENPKQFKTFVAAREKYVNVHYVWGKSDWRESDRWGKGDWRGKSDRWGKGDWRGKSDWWGKGDWWDYSKGDVFWMWSHEFDMWAPLVCHQDTSAV